MPAIPLYIAGAAALGYLLRGSADAMDSAASLGRVAVVGGVVYVAYKAATR